MLTEDYKLYINVIFIGKYMMNLFLILWVIVINQVNGMTDWILIFYLVVYVRFLLKHLISKECSVSIIALFASA